MRRKLIETSRAENTTISINTSDLFKNQNLHYEEMLEYFEIAALELQKRKSTLHECRFVIDSLVELAEDDKNEIGSELYC